MVNLRKSREGDYAIPITIQKRIASPVRDANNKTDWTDPANYETHLATFCRIEKQSGREFMFARQLQSDLSAILIVRSSSLTRQVDATFRVLFRGRTLEVVESFDIEERLAEIEIHCREAK